MPLVDGQVMRRAAVADPFRLDVKSDTTRCDRLSQQALEAEFAMAVAHEGHVALHPDQLPEVGIGRAVDGRLGKPGRAVVIVTPHAEFDLDMVQTKEGDPAAEAEARAAKSAARAARAAAKAAKKKPATKKKAAAKKKPATKKKTTATKKSAATKKKESPSSAPAEPAAVAAAPSGDDT